MTPCAMAIGRVRAALAEVRRRRACRFGTLPGADRWTLYDGIGQPPDWYDPDALDALLRVGVTGLEPGARGWR
jgi:hypothetical protein